MQKNNLKIIFVGGGTGGHVAPNLAIIEELQKISERKKIILDILYVGRRSGIEKELARSKGLRYRGIFTGKLRRYFSWHNFTDLFLIFLGFFQSFFILLFNRPGIIFAKGGFVTVPFCLAAAVLRIPFVIHESDSVIGLSNKILFPFSKKMFLGFSPSAYKKLPIQKISFSGSPVRPEILGIKRDQRSFAKKYDLDNSKPTVFVFGGSQGSGKINQLIDAVLERMVEKYNLVHQTGKNEKEYFQKRALDLKDSYRRRYKVFGYIGDELKDFLNNADIIISRAGANSIAEIIAMRKPAILIPLPSAAADHQTSNARFLQKNGISVVLDENVIDGNVLFEEISEIASNKKKRESMIASMENVFPENSSRLIAEGILDLANKY